MSYNTEPLHPESLRQLEQLIKLHGAMRIMDAVYGMTQRSEAEGSGQIQYKAVKEATRLADSQLTLLKEVAKKKARAADLSRRNLDDAPEHPDNDMDT